MASKKVLISGTDTHVEALGKHFEAAGIDQVTLAQLEDEHMKSDDAKADYYVQLGVVVPARGDTAVTRVQSFLNDGLLERFALAARVLPLLAPDAVVLLVAGNTTAEGATAPDDHAARLSLLRVLAHALRADFAPGRIRVRVITSRRTDGEIAEFALSGAKDSEALPERRTADIDASEDSYGDWRIQIMGLAQLEM